MPVTHWGQWIWNTASACGFHSQRYFAERVGVTPAVMSKWVNSERPPNLRATSLESLAKCLNTHPDIVRSDFVFFDGADITLPTRADYESAKRTTPSKDESALGAIQQLKATGDELGLIPIMTDELLRRRVAGMVNQMDGKRLRDTYEFCKATFDEWLQDADDLLK